MTDAAAAAARPPAVSARAVAKSFGSVRAVAGIDLDVPAGACFGLIGENGAGKTTFIKMLLGITRPDGGSIGILGGSPEDAHVRAQIGYLPERLTMPEAFSPIRFLASVGRIKGLSSGEISADTDRVLELVQLDRAAWKRSTGGFSKGMKQRTGLAAALLGKPRLLVLDEPTDGIDPLGRAQIRDVIASTVAAGATVFLNSHLLAESEKICNHVAVLSAGRVITSGALDVLKRKDAWRVRFVRRADGRDIEIAKKHGFIHTADRDEDRIYKYEGASGQALSSSLQAALEGGLVVIEVSPELKDLETILRESIVKRQDQDAAAAAAAAAAGGAESSESSSTGGAP